jgi:hypothetical protein
MLKKIENLVGHAATVAIEFLIFATIFNTAVGILLRVTS